MPILEAHHDRGHAVEGDSAWSESYYFNGYDPATDSGFFTRVGIRPNEGTMDVGMSVWLPTGELAEYRSIVEQREMVDTTLSVGAVRYQMREPMTTWHLTMDADATARPCTRGALESRPVHVSLDVTFDALAPPIGTDGEGGSGPRTAEAAAAASSVGKGHFEQAGTWTGSIVVDGTELVWSAARGNRDRSWGPRRWGGPTMWRWFSINVGDDLHFGGIRIGTGAGDLHRGWVWDRGRATSVAEWQLETELANDAVTHRVVHLTVLDKSGHSYPLRGDVLRIADIGRAGGTVVNEGLTKWTYLDPAGPARVGYGIAEYLHQLNEDGRPVVAVE
jgi:hypothetical protein